MRSWFYLSKEFSFPGSIYQSLSYMHGLKQQSRSQYCHTLSELSFPFTKTWYYKISIKYNEKYGHFSKWKHNKCQVRGHTCANNWQLHDLRLSLGANGWKKHSITKSPHKESGLKKKWRQILQTNKGMNKRKNKHTNKQTKIRDQNIVYPSVNAPHSHFTL